MRITEWLIVPTFIPSLLLPFISAKSRRIGLLMSTVPLVLVVGLHFLVEGWRIQMLPIYCLAILCLSGRIPGLLRAETIVRRKQGVILSIGIAIILLGGIIVAAWLLPVISLPEPNGPFAVGVVDRELLDVARDRRLMVSVWYPANVSGEAAPLTHYPDAVATALGNLSGLPAVMYQHLRYANVAASEGAAPLAENAPFPVLVFSHGMVGLRLQNSSTLQNLASWGYVVVAIDHTDAAAVTVFPDGEARFYNLGNFGIAAGVEVTIDLMNEHVFPVWVADQMFIYDTLERWAENDVLLAGKLDLNSIGSFGHSFGGATALEVCRIDARCRAAGNLDGGLYGHIARHAATRPLLLMSSAESNQFPDTIAAWSRMIENANAPAYWLELPNSSHLSFTITQLLSPLLVPNGFDPRTGLQTIDQYLRLFFDTHLRGTAAFPLDSTDVRWLSSDLLH